MLTNDSRTQETTRAEQITFSWSNKHFDNLWQGELNAIVEAMCSLLIHMLLPFKILAADLRKKKSIVNNIVNKKDHLIKKLLDT